MKAVDIIITELAVFAFPDGKLTLIDVILGTIVEEVRVKTSASFVEIM